MNTPTLAPPFWKYPRQPCPKIWRPQRAGILLKVLLLLTLGGASNPISADDVSSKAAEQWVLMNVTAGREANLEDFTSDEEGRKISAEFLKELLVNDNSSVKVPRVGVRILNAVVTGPLDLTHEEIRHDVRLIKCFFPDKVIFLQTHFKSNLHLEDSTFDGFVDFRFSVIDGTLEAKRVRFNPEKPVVVEGESQPANQESSPLLFTQMRVVGPVFFDHAHFARLVNFYGSVVGGNFSTTNAEFLQAAEFELMKVNGHLFLNYATFNGPVRFYRTTATENFETDGASFNDATNVANFEGLQANAALFRSTTFEGPVRFYGAIVRTNFDADNSIFRFPHGFVVLENMNIGGNVFVRRAVFKGGVSFFSSTVGGRLDFFEARFEDTRTGVFLNGIKTDSMGLGKTVFNGPIEINGMAYHQILSGGGDAMLSMINQAKYDDGAYAQLEQYYRQQGNLSQADGVYIAGRRRERKDDFFGPRWVGSVMLDFLVGYGRKPWRVLFWSIIIIGVGWYVFRRRDFMDVEPGSESRHYHGFLYSLDLFLPIVDLQMASRWQPKDESRVARRYLPFHVILGWILVTILVAALSGLLK